MIFTREKLRPCTNRIVTVNTAAIISINKRTNQTCTGTNSAPSSQDVVNKMCTALQPRSTPPGLAQAYDAHKPRQTYLRVCLPLFRLFSITVSLQFQATRNMACISPLQRKGHNTQKNDLPIPCPIFSSTLTTLIPPECYNNFVESKQLRHQTLLHLFCRILGCY